MDNGNDRYGVGGCILMTGQAPVTTLDTERGGGEDRGDQATGHMEHR